MEITSRGAEISPCGKYRYTLWRSWAPITGLSKLMVFVMLNPSTADGETDDNTIRKCIHFAQREKFDHMMVVNLYAFRSTDPNKLWGMGAEEVRGPDNFCHVRAAIASSDRVVCAWGNPGGAKRWRLIGDGPLWCLGTNKDGSPKHPLYLAKNTPMVPWTPK